MREPITLIFNPGTLSEDELNDLISKSDRMSRGDVLDALKLSEEALETERSMKVRARDQRNTLAKTLLARKDFLEKFVEALKHDVFPVKGISGMVPMERFSEADRDRIERAAIKVIDDFQKSGVTADMVKQAADMGDRIFQFWKQKGEFPKSRDDLAGIPSPDM